MTDARNGLCRADELLRTCAGENLLATLDVAIAEREATMLVPPEQRFHPRIVAVMRFLTSFDAIGKLLLWSLCAGLLNALVSSLSFLSPWVGTGIVAGTFAFLVSPAPLVCEVLLRKATHSDIARFLRKRSTVLAALRHDIAAFQEARARIHLVAGRSELYEELVAQSYKKRQELIARRDAFLRDLDDQIEWTREAQSREAQVKGLLEERKNLKALAADIEKVLPADSSNGGLTQDVAGHVATLQAIDQIESEVHEMTAQEPPPRRERE